MNHKYRPPFLTGSRIFGYSTPSSDLDLVMYFPDGLTDSAALTLMCASGLHDRHNTNAIRFGILNIIAVNDKEYDAWKDAKKEVLDLKDQGIQITRELAVDIHHRICQERDIDDHYHTEVA